MKSQKKWLKSGKNQLFVRKNRLLEREKEEIGFSGEEVAGHHPTTSLTVKIGSLPKMDQDGCKTKVWQPTRVVRGPENRLLGAGSGV